MSEIQKLKIRGCIEWMEGRIEELEKSIRGHDPRYFGVDKIVEKIEYYKEEIELLKSKV